MAADDELINRYASGLRISDLPDDLRLEIAKRQLPKGYHIEKDNLDHILIYHSLGSNCSAYIWVGKDKMEIIHGELFDIIEVRRTKGDK